MHLCFSISFIRPHVPSRRKEKKVSKFSRSRSRAPGQVSIVKTRVWRSRLQQYELTLTRLSSSYSSRSSLDGHSVGTAPEVATRELREGRGTHSQVSAMWPRLQVQTQPVEACEIRVRRSQELLLRPMRTQFHAERQFAPPPDAES